MDAVDMQQQIEGLVRSKMEELTAKRIRQVSDGGQAHNYCMYLRTSLSVASPPFYSGSAATKDVFHGGGSGTE